MSFDPEKVDKWFTEGYMADSEEVVSSADYDQLLALYQGTEKSRAAAMRLIERLTNALRCL